MKKINLIWIFGILLVSIVYALTLSNPYPNGNVLNGTTSQFNISGDVNLTTGWVLIDNGTATNSYSLVCSGNVCNNTVSLSNYNDLTTFRHYYFVDGTPSSWYNFIINRVPSKPTGMQATTFNASAINISWSLNPEADIFRYRLYKNNLSNLEINYSNNIANLSNTTAFYIDYGVVLGATYFYKLVAEDNVSQTEISDEINATVADATPPVDPIVSPASGSIVNATNPTINITYPDTQNVTLYIYSGDTLVKSFTTPALMFTWNPVLSANTTYLFNFNANDPFNNQKNTSYQITTTAMADINISILDTIHITTIPTVIKSSALAGENIVIKYSISMYGGAYTRVKMTDLTNAYNTIYIPSQSQPVSFCGEDYNSTTQDIISSPTKSVYYVLTSYNETQNNSLNCTDTDGSGSVGYDIYLKIPLPTTATSGSYSSTVNIGMYSTQ